MAKAIKKRRLTVIKRNPQQTLEFEVRQILCEFIPACAVIYQCHS
jgi:hypothetical protein